MAINALVVIASVIACAAVGWILWWSFGRVRSGGKKLLITVGTALLGYVLYVLVQIVGENVYPSARGANGHIIAYDLHIFTLALVVVIVAMFVLRQGTTATMK